MSERAKTITTRWCLTHKTTSGSDRSCWVAAALGFDPDEACHIYVAHLKVTLDQLPGEVTLADAPRVWWCERWKREGDQDYCANGTFANTHHKDCGWKALVDWSEE